MAFCFLFVASSVRLSVYVCWSIAMYGGISMDISPSGPLTCTVLIDCVLAPFPPTVLGGITLSVTLGGTESGSEPILDSHRAVVVKALGAANRGNKKVGIEALEGAVRASAMARAHRRRAGANMVWAWASWVRAKFLGSCVAEGTMFSPTD